MFWRETKIRLESERMDEGKRLFSGRCHNMSYNRCDGGISGDASYGQGIHRHSSEVPSSLS